MNLRKRDNRPTAEVHTAALNDIMFFLLLFFLLASAVANPQVVKLLLPRSQSGEQSVAKKTISLSINKDLQYFVEKEQVPLDQLMPALQTYVQEGQELTVLLYVDRTVAIEDVIEVMDIANKLKIKLVLATEPKEKS
ncbi:biopolymer transporter ExbD [Olivibacter sp. SDN3]|uniref:ExbD/TolR family protein n=1 Tax=Olivibacter sp. SDN3 TaxID=2764720 RepID=UPI0016511E38|nr:biopolymer transporter ExbD [Olivibacter sp. SDN3]QNL52135.1 biopolymer transporter ExbD [Olivibacter sp. SDN3]